VISARTQKAAHDLRAVREWTEVVMAECRETALADLAGGAFEQEVADALGVNRLTVRRWRGK